MGEAGASETISYESLRTRFRWEIPKEFNFGADVVDRWAEEPERIALVWADDAGQVRRFTFGDIRRLTNKFANYLASKGIRKGDRIVVMLPRIPEWQIAMIGCLKLGAVPIPCVTMLTHKDINYRVEHSGAVAAVTTAANVEKFSAPMKARLSVSGGEGWDDFEGALSGQSDVFEPAILGEDDPAVMFYTSGSTGMPKGVCHATRALYAWRLSAQYWLSLTEQDVMWCTADTGWSKAGTSILFGPWSCGSSVFFYDGPFEPEKRMDLIARHGVTVFCAAATEIRQILGLNDLDRKPETLRLTVSAGETVNPEVVSSWVRLTGSPLLDGYGQTETLMTILNYPFMEVKPGSMGRPLPGTEAAVLREDGSVAPCGETGQLAIRTPNPQIMLGYWNDPDRTADSFLEHAGVRWFLTGDTAAMDEDGYFFFRGRNDDIINSAGYRIGPTEVENALIEHPAVIECAAVASPDPERGEVVKAFVILKSGVVGDGALVKELQSLAKSLTAPYKYPRKIEFVSTLPKTSTGKIQRHVLKKWEFEGRD